VIAPGEWAADDRQSDPIRIDDRFVRPSCGQPPTPTARLRDRGLQVTAQRVAILEAVADCPHASAAGLWTRTDRAMRSRSVRVLDFPSTSPRLILIDTFRKGRYDSRQ